MLKKKVIKGIIYPKIKIVIIYIIYIEHKRRYFEECR